MLKYNHMQSTIKEKMTDIDQNEELLANLFQQVEEEEEEIQIYTSI